jgi:eukaryotic-like serine/threonine-protein kinase
MTDLDEIVNSRVGATLRDKYRLERVLGVGGMAAVYQATHRNGHRAALKILHPHMSVNKDVRERFLREGYVANRVEHRGAVKVTDDDTAEDGSVFLAMELLSGEPLDARWHRFDDRLPPREVAELAHQLLDVLAAAHEKGIVHRDIKPENLFLTDEGVLKVLDFGIARFADASAPRAATRTGRMLGSPAFMAPEQALGLQRDVDGQTDLWSVGATMFALVSGKYVHDVETVEMLLVYAGSRPARPVRSVAQDVPPLIATVIDHALAFDKSQRWRNAREMQVALVLAYGEVYGAAMPGVQASRSPSTPVLAGPQVQRPLFENIEQTIDSSGTEIMVKPRAPARGSSTTAGMAKNKSPSERPPILPRSGRGAAVALAVAVGVGLTAVAVVTGLGRFGIGPEDQTRSVGAASLPILAPSAALSPAAPPPGSVNAPSTSVTVSASASAPPAAPNALRPANGPRLVPRPPPHAAPPPPAPELPPAATPQCRTVLDRYDSNYQPIYRQDCH